MNNSNVTQRLKTALLACQDMVSALGRDDKLAADYEAELTALQSSTDLSDGKALDRISRLTTAVAVAANRRESLEEAIAAAKRGLITLCHDFISSVLAPRCQELEQKAVAKLSPAFPKQLFPSADGLMNAINQSAPMARVRELQSLAKIQVYASEAALGHAQELIEALAATEDFERKHLS